MAVEPNNNQSIINRIMSTPSIPIESKAAQQLQLMLKHTTVLLPRPLQTPSPPLFTILAPLPLITILDFRSVAQSNRTSSPEPSAAVAQKMHEKLSRLIAVLEHNEECRLSWEQGAGGRLDRGFKIDTHRLVQEQQTLQALIQQGQKGVGSKSELLDYIAGQQKYIFEWKEDSGLEQSFQPVLLPDFPESYELTTLLTDQAYFLAYQNIIESLYLLNEQVKQYLEAKTSLSQFSQLCLTLGHPESLITNRTRTNELIKYALCFTGGKYRMMAQLRQRTRQLRSLLINSTIRAFYVAFNVQKDIIGINNILDRVQEVVVKRMASQQSQQEDQSLRVLNQQINAQKTQVENRFSTIFAYLTDTTETVYVNLFSRKLNKRCRKLFDIQERIISIEKILFQSCEAGSIIRKIKARMSHSEPILTRKFRQLEEMRREFSPMNDYQFRVLFEQTQTMMVFVQETDNYMWKQKVRQFEEEIVNDRMRDQRDSGNWGTARHSSIGQSRISCKGRNSRVIIEHHLFEESYSQLAERRSMNVNCMAESESLNRVEVYGEGMAYLSEIGGEMAEELRDQSNFKVYLLPQLTSQVEQALKATIYSDQPLYSQLTRLLSNLKFIPLLIKPELNEQNLDLILYPNLNCELFTSFRDRMVKYYGQVNGAYTQLKGDEMRKEVIEKRIQLFAQLRIRFIGIVLEHIDRLEVIARRVGEVCLAREVYELESEGTYQVVLTLLLAEKEVKVLKRSLEDGIGKQLASKKAILLITQRICPLFIRSLPYQFEYKNNDTAPNTLATLLELSQLAHHLMLDSNQLMDDAVRTLESMQTQGRRVTQFQQTLKEVSLILASIRDHFQEAIVASKRFACVSVEKVDRQLVRIQEFLDILQSSDSVEADLVDDRSKYLLRLIKQLRN